MTDVVRSVDVLRQFYEAWNGRDVDAIARCFADDGAFVDPLGRRPLRRAALRAHLDALVAALPDLRVSVSHLHRDDGHAVATWSLGATCRGSLDAELAADGASFVVDGVDVFELAEDGRIRSARRHFDRRTLAEQIGMQSIVEPVSVGSMTFGYSLRDWASTAKPGVLGMTWIQARDDEEKAKIRGYARRIIQGFRDIPGYVGVLTEFAGLHGFTVTAWKDEDALRAGVHGAHHVEAMRGFHQGTSSGVFTSVWQPLRLNRLWLRCPTCGTPNDAATAGGRCGKCESPLPEAPPYV